MKKLTLLLVLFIFGCQSIAEKTTPQPNKKAEEAPVIITKPGHIFESHDLTTPTINSKKISVALLLPLSGKHQELGWNLANASFISLFDNDDDHNIELILFDSKGTSKGAKNAFQEIINHDIKLVIGPVFSSALAAIQESALQNSITVISLSNNPKFVNKTDESGGIFLAGMMPESEIDRIVEYAMDSGKYNFAIISPNNQYGNTVTSLFKKIVKGRDGDFITAQFYKANDRDLNRAVNRVINSFTIPKDFKTDEQEVSEEDKIYPQVIMIPQSGRVLNKIIASIKEQNIAEREFQIIGTSQWDDISTLNNYNLNGSWFAAPENKRFHNFEQKYFELYGKFPPRISSIAYDAVMAAAVLAENNDGETTPTINDFLNYEGKRFSNANGFSGIDGLFRFLPNGLVQRNLAVLEVDNGNFKTIDKPVKKFLQYE